MAKFKKGNRVEMVGNNSFVPKGSKGTVIEDHSTIPFVDWDKKTVFRRKTGRNDNIVSTNENKLKLIEEFEYNELVIVKRATGVREFGIFKEYYPQKKNAKVLIAEGKIMTFPVDGAIFKTEQPEYQLSDTLSQQFMEGLLNGFGEIYESFVEQYPLTLDDVFPPLWAKGCSEFMEQANKICFDPISNPSTQYAPEYIDELMCRGRIIPFSIESLKVKDFFGVVTRNGYKVENIAVHYPPNAEPNVRATIPGRKDCRGNYQYGFLLNGKAKEKGDDELDLFIMLKDTECAYPFDLKPACKVWVKKDFTKIFFKELGFKHKYKFTAGEQETISSIRSSTLFALKADNNGNPEPVFDIKDFDEYFSLTPPKSIELQYSNGRGGWTSMSADYLPNITIPDSFYLVKKIVTF